MQREQLADHWRQVYANASMRGWDFGVLDGRLSADETPWDFERLCRDELSTARRALDLGTGGGERLLRLHDDLKAGWPELVATEGWAPNLPVARENLAPLGVPVLAYQGEERERLGLPDQWADVVMCRHEALDPAEITRVLACGGVLLEQQVDGRDAAELRSWFGGEPQYPHVRLEIERAALQSAGLVVDRALEWSGRMGFADVDALLEYLAMVPWEVACFQVDDHLDRLGELHARGELVVTQRRFLLVAHRP